MYKTVLDSMGGRMRGTLRLRLQLQDWGKVCMSGGLEERRVKSVVKGRYKGRR